MAKTGVVRSSRAAVAPMTTAKTVEARRGRPGPEAGERRPELAPVRPPERRRQGIGGAVGGEVGERGERPVRHAGVVLEPADRL
jgi:hypothetical protein